MTSAAPPPVDRHVVPSLTRREAGLTAVSWAAVAVVAMVLRAAARRLSGHELSLAATGVDLTLLAMWAGATPLVLRSAVRWPVAGARAIRHGAVHLAMGTGFVVATNVLIRMPELWERGAAAMAFDTMLGVATYYPTAIIAYGVIVAIGNRMFASSRSTQAATVAEPEPDDDRLVLREWNRVHFVALDDIEWIEADNNHVVVHATSRVYKARERLGDVEAKLDPRRFVRVHRSALVQISKIREAQPLMHGDHVVILCSGAVVRVARSRRRALEDALGIPL